MDKKLIEDPVGEPERRTARTPKGKDRRQQIIDAAAEMIRLHGPGSVSHRSVASKVGCSLSAMTYYFSGLDELLEAAGRVNIARWAKRIEDVAESLELGPPPSDRAAVIRVILSATLPADEALLGHYEHLIGAGSADPITRAYRTGRDRHSAAMARVLACCDVDCDPELVMAVVDGAAVCGLSEGRDVRETTASLINDLLDRIGNPSLDTTTRRPRTRCAAPPRSTTGTRRGKTP